MRWTIRNIKKTWRERNRGRQLAKRLNALAPEDSQCVRAYLALNSRDEAFIQELLKSAEPVGRLRR
jgi:hypothetical protein